MRSEDIVYQPLVLMSICQQRKSNNICVVVLSRHRYSVTRGIRGILIAAIRVRAQTTAEFCALHGVRTLSAHHWAIKADLITHLMLTHCIHNEMLTLNK